MKNFKTNSLLLLFVVFLLGCNSNPPKENNHNELVSKMEQQLNQLADSAMINRRIPRTVHDENIRYTGLRFDWTEGFFPGTCWYMFELTGDQKWKERAEELQQLIVEHRFITTNHDLGFVFNCSFGNGLRLTENPEYNNVLIDASNSLITRFNPTVGCIKSWDVERGWQSERGWEYPVIIDNMMNLEMLFEVSKLTGDDKFKEIAITHANTTIKNHFREDGSSYHVIDYDPLSGEVRNKHTAQGYEHESSWARGQAWGLYGYTVCYRYTGDERYLEQAEKIANCILTHPNLPEDMVPYWDFNAPNIPDALRDASAAAIIASALIELDGYSKKEYLHQAKSIVNSLTTEKYMSAVGENHNFLLKHCVGSIPHGAEIDVPLNYADYYYTEAVYRLTKF